MKIEISKLIIIIVLFFLSKQLGSGQGFVNLDFESANVSGYSLGSVPATSAIPGWTAYISGVQQTDIIYNTVPLSAPEVTLQGTNNGLYPPVQGNYFVMLWGEFNPSQNGTETNNAAIGQTGQIPPSTQSLDFWGNMGGMQITFDGQLLNFITIGSTNSYNIYSADISSFAGKTGELLFTDPDYGNTFGGPGILDNIQLSTSSVPEPRVLGLSALGGLLLAWRRWRKSFQI